TIPAHSKKLRFLMDSKMSMPTTVGEYIDQFPQEVQEIMVKIREVIKEAEPRTEEKISYGMPAYYLNGVLIYFAGYKKYISLYPLTEGMKALKEAEVYKGTKATIHFPLDKPMPYALIREIVKIRVAENTESS
ncbi:MAG TPA: DUF1801 domain-containing protein, partial [Bellilinea sp.]|nr:DUF1801 domain-containing protein [Bellilinea sp.]